MDRNKRPYNEAGRRLKAALISYQLGMKGVDRTLKEMPEDCGEGWAEVAEDLLRGMSNQIAVSLRKTKSTNVITIR